MKRLQFITTLFAFVVILLACPRGLAQGQNGKNPVPKAGVLIEPVQKNKVPESKFTNRTADDLAIIYGREKFSLKSGENKTVPVPQQPMSDLRIFEKRAPGKPAIERVHSKAGPNDPKRFIPFPWTKPNKPNKP